LKQPDHIHEQVQLAATGNREAFTELILTQGPGLRLLLAAHVESFSAVAPLELAVWVTASGCLGDYDTAHPFSEWLFALAVAPLTEHLQMVAARALVVQDLVTHRLARDSLTALSDGSESRVLTLAALLDALPANVRTLLVARYRDRHSLSHMAGGQGNDVPALANTVITGRAQCDWRAIAKPPAASDRDLPPLIEDLMSGIIDNAARGVMADYFARDQEQVLQMARQVRVHVALRVFFMPFVRAHAVVLARQAYAGHVPAGHVVATAPVHIPVVPSSAGNEKYRTPRALSGPPVSPAQRNSASSSNLPSARAAKELKESQQDPDDQVAVIKPRRRASPLPYIIAGVLVLGGVLGLLATTRSGSTPSVAARTEAPIPPPLPERKLTEITTTPLPAEGDARRPLPLVAAKPSAGPVQVTLVGVVADSHPYAGHEVVLRSALSSEVGITRVEYWNADTKLGEATTAPWTFSWTPTAGAQALSARAVTQEGESTTSAKIALTVVTTYGSGSLRREWWTGIPGDQLKDLDKIPGFPARPQGHALVEQFAAPSKWADNYVQRVWGFLIPPLDGDYVFWIAADDEAELWLSNDDTVQSRQRIAVSAWIPGSGTKLMEWDRQPGQRSAPIHLQAGRRYLIEALHKEGRADDHLEVGWRLPDGTLERPIPGIHLSPPVVDPEPGTPSPMPVPPPAVATLPPPMPTWTVVHAINLGGETVEIDGVRWLGQRQAEAEGATPANSNQPGPWVSDVPWTRATNGNGPVRRDRSTQERPLTIDGKIYAKGLGVHSTGEVVYAIDGQWTGFTALAGVDDEVDGAKAEVIFQVWLDGQKAWDSGAMRKGSGTKAVAVSLAGRKELRLVIDPSGPGDWDHGDWVNAQFLRPGGGDGTLQIKTGKRSVVSYTPKPAVDAKLRSLLNTALSGTSKEGLEFSVRAPNGPLRVWLWAGESGAANSRQFDLSIAGVVAPTMTGLPASGWQKLGPFDVLVTDEQVTVKATPIKGSPQLMGFLAERPELPQTAP
jgi:DNA-directed RNA polymerase specialized sigma24 family protein